MMRAIECQLHAVFQESGLSVSLYLIAAAITDHIEPDLWNGRPSFGAGQTISLHLYSDILDGYNSVENVMIKYLNYFSMDLIHFPVV